MKDRLCSFLSFVLFCFFWGYLFVLPIGLVLSSCVPSPPKPLAPLPSPSKLALASPTSLESETLLPPEEPPIVTSCELKNGQAVGPGFYLSKGMSASLGGELERLAGLPKAYQDTERAKAALVIEEGNKQAQDLAQLAQEEREAREKAELKAYRWQKAATPIALSSAAAGMLLTLFLLTY